MGIAFLNCQLSKRDALHKAKINDDWISLFFNLHFHSFITLFIYFYFLCCIYKLMWREKAISGWTLWGWFLFPVCGEYPKDFVNLERSFGFQLYIDINYHTLFIGALFVVGEFWIILSFSFSFSCLFRRTRE